MLLISRVSIEDATVSGENKQLRSLHIRFCRSVHTNCNSRLLSRPCNIHRNLHGDVDSVSSTAPPSPLSDASNLSTRKHWADHDWADDDYWCKKDNDHMSKCYRGIYGYFGILYDGEEDDGNEEVVTTEEKAHLFPSLREERTAWSKKTRGQPRTQRMVRRNRRRRTTRRKNKKRRCPRHIRDRRRRRVLRQKQLIRLARVGGRLHRLAFSIRGGGNPLQGEQVSCRLTKFENVE